MELIAGIIIGLLLANLVFLSFTWLALKSFIGKDLKIGAEMTKEMVKDAVRAITGQPEAKGVIFDAKTFEEIQAKQKAEAEAAHLLDPLADILKSRE